MRIPLDINGDPCEKCGVVDAEFGGQMKEDMHGDLLPVVNISVRLCARHAKELFGHDTPIIVNNSPQARMLPA